MTGRFLGRIFCSGQALGREMMEVARSIPCSDCPQSTQPLRGGEAVLQKMLL